MPKDTRRQRTKCIFNVLITLVVFITTAVVIHLYTRFGLTIIDTPNSIESIRNIVDVKSNLLDRDIVSLVTISPTTVTAINSKQDEKLQNTVGSVNDSHSTLTVTNEERQIKRFSATKLLQLSSRSLNKDTTQGDHFEVGPSLSRNTLIPSDSRDNLTDNDSRMANDHNDHNTTFVIISYDENDQVGITNETGLHQTSNRQVKHKQINHNDYTLTDKSATEEDGSAVYHNPYHLSYNVGEYGYKNDDNQVDETVWPAVVKSEPTIPESTWPVVMGGSSGWDRPAYGGVPVDYGHDYKPLVRSPKIPIKTHHSLIHHKTNTFDWHKIGMLALIKLGIVKLKAIGFFNALLLLAFKFKLYMIAVFFKFLLIMKLLKFFKILLVPLFLVRSLPTIFQQLSSSMQLVDMIRRPTSSSAGSTTQIGQTDSLLPNILRPGGITGTSGSEIISGGGGTAGSAGLSGGGSFSSMSGGSSGGTLLPGTIAGGNRLPGGTGLASFKLDDSDLFSGRPNDSILESRHDPALDIFQQILDSEKCVERIACRIAAAEKTGIMPFWINWMLFRISKFIPNDKLESYLKTYKDVNNEIHVKSSIPDNWATWCSERYECNNNSNNVSRATNTNK